MCIAFKEHTRICDIHAAIDAAAVVNKKSKTFQIWNLKTGVLMHQIPQASDSSLIRFSANGSIMITTALFPSDAKKTLITLWHRETKKSFMQFIYEDEIENIFFENKFLHVVDKSGTLYIAHLNIENKTKTKVSQINAGIEKMNPPFTFQGKYCVDTNAILQQSFPYFLCKQAIKNTSSVASLKKIYDTPFYTSDSLTQDQRKTIRQKIKNKINDLSKKNEPAKTTMSLFG